MNTKIAMSGLSILAALSLMGGATFAFFSDTGNTSVGNTFAAGSLDLKLDDNDETTPANSVSGSLGVGSSAPFVPGASVSGFISLHNSGTVDIAEVEMAIDTVENVDGGAASDLRDVINLTVLVDDTTPDSACVGGTDVTSVIDTAVGSGGGNLTLAEFDDGGVDVYDAFLTGTGLAVGATRNICFTATFDSGAGNEYQGDSVTSTFTFTGNQNASQ